MGDAPGTMDTVRSRDGTPIAYERRGSGPALILVGGGLDDGSENAPLAAELADAFTTYNYARRGRGASGDAPQYSVAHELEDLAALVAAAGGSAHVYGASSGGMFGLEAAMAGLAIDRIALYEIPYDTSEGAEQRFDEYREELSAALAAGRRGDAVALFMRLAGSPEEQIAGARASSFWPGVEALAHTLAYDAALYGPPPLERLAAVEQRTLVLTGEGTGFFDAAADAVAGAIPGAERARVPGAGHVVDPLAIAPLLRRFYGR